MSALTGIQLLVLDFDGVMTDNRVIVREDGLEAVVCHRGDGMGIEMVRKAGIEVLVLSREDNPVVAARCRKLKIDCVHGVKDKIVLFQDMIDERELNSAQVAYVGNDVNDLDCMQYAGTGVAVADSHPEALAVADVILETPGGHGAVREFCDMLLASRQSPQ